MSKSETTLCVASTSGTEYEHLPKSEIRKRLQRGSMRQSQFIWHPDEQSWKQAKTFPDFADPSSPHATKTASESTHEDPTLCVALPSGSEYEHLPKSEIRKRLQQGSMRQSQFIWHPDEQSWKQAKTFPDLIHSPTLKASVPAVAAPIPRVPVAVIATAAPKPAVIAQPSPHAPRANASVMSKSKAALKVSAAVKPLPPSQPESKTSATSLKAAPATKTLTKSQPVARVPSFSTTAPEGVVAPQAAAKANFADEMVRKQRRSQKLYAWLSGGLLVMVLFLNWLCAHHALTSAISQSEFKGKINVAGHYGFFASPFVLIIHLGEMPPEMSPEKFIDLLTLLAVNTQKQPLTGFNYHTIKLKKGLSTKFALRGAAWKVLAEMKNLPSTARGMLLTDNLYLPNGKQALSSKSDNLIEIAQEKRKLFSEFYNTFVGKKNAP